LGPFGLYPMNAGIAARTLTITRSHVMPKVTKPSTNLFDHGGVR